MRKLKSTLFAVCILMVHTAAGQNFAGRVVSEQGEPISNADVLMLESNATTKTDVNGAWQLTASNQNLKTLVFHKNGFTYEQLLKQAPSRDLTVVLRNAIKSAATLREDGYKINGCNTVSVPDDPTWNVNFTISNLKGDLAPDPNYTRRDPSAVIQVNGTYYVWYSYSLTFDNNKLAPWDLNDIYYATSADGLTWKEKGIAVGRGTSGSFDARSVFTTEILAHNGKYYLVYQAAADADGIYNRNTVGMSVADSPDGPWTKLTNPVLTPTYTNDLFFDNNAVHDPCIIPYENKFYLYYKGECNCRSNTGCKQWCNPVCGLGKQVKWGVAIADNPTGPYVKSASNPITNTGHEVMVWPFKTGIAILQHQDGPEPNTIQFSENGVDFSIMGNVSNIPEAAGLFRAGKSDTNPHAGISWGMGHKLNWNAGPNGWMNLYRFDIVEDKVNDVHIIADKLQIGVGQSRVLTVKTDPFLTASNALVWKSKNQNVAKVTNGTITGMAVGVTTIYALNRDAVVMDSCEVYVQATPFDATIITVSANSFNASGGTFSDAASGGPGYGIGKTSSGINFVNKDDWATFTISVPATGVYELSYIISTPMANAGVSLQKESNTVAVDAVFSNGAWDSYYTLPADQVIRFDRTGTVNIKLLASGSDDWQWNMKSLTFERLTDQNFFSGFGSRPSVRAIRVSYNTFSRQCRINGVTGNYLVELYSIKGEKLGSERFSGNASFEINDKPKGVYFLKVVTVYGNYTSKLLM